jgi:cysteine synthase A
LIFQNIIEAIGRTPLVRLNRIPQSDSANVFGKMESMNPCHSVKDRIGAAMIEQAEKDGSLKPGMTIVEPTSGNTGIALAMAGAVKGYRIILTMPDTASLERRHLMKLLGAELILTPGEDGMKGAIEKAGELVAEGGFYMPMQFVNPANPETHRRTTAREIIQDLDNLKLDAFVAGVGTGGTLTGTGEILKKKYKCKIYAVEPADSPVLSGGEPSPHKIQGMGAGFVPDNYNPDIVDNIIRVTNEDAIQTARQLAKEEGILAGISSGANIWAACRVASELAPGKNIVTIICDTGERYLTTDLV